MYSEEAHSLLRLCREFVAYLTDETLSAWQSVCTLVNASGKHCPNPHKMFTPSMKQTQGSGGARITGTLTP